MSNNFIERTIRPLTRKVQKTVLNIYYFNYRLPNFLIIGTQKGGTSSLYHYLTQHPKIIASKRKEVHFFDLNYDKGVGWYKSFFPKKSNGKYQNFITGEASPYYLYDSSVPEKVSELIPEVKLIVLLRDPVSRAYSHYMMEKNRRNETLTFEKAIERERMSAHQFTIKEKIRFSYLDRGIYINQIKRWLNFFDENQFIFIKSEDFFTNPSEIYEAVLNHLQLPGFMPKKFRIMNQGEYDSSKEIKDETLLSLQNFYQDYNLKLIKELGIKITWDYE